MKNPPVLDQLLNPDVLLRVAMHMAGESVTDSADSTVGALDLGLRFEDLVEAVRTNIRDGFDPLGTAYCRINSPIERRPRGQTFTPNQTD